ncbi:MAG: Holliday junction resolvase RecU [Vallitalea sp.]|jgi:recombination protein U|nr:Holliday junction resolvase RecU [Vallitalea sp.]
MAKNAGKQFEDDFKASIPKEVFYYRFRDGTANFNGQKNENVRFQQYNICDCLLYKGNRLFLLELKSTKKKSVPFSMIRKTQIDQLLKASPHKNIIAGFIFNFREHEETYYLDVITIKNYIDTADRKSFPIDWVRDNGVLIQQRKLVKNYRYNVQDFINEFRLIRE